jgi:hypothetical protein
MRKVLLTGVVLAALVFAAVAGAVAESVFKLGNGDSAFLKGSHVVCAAGTAPSTGNELSCWKKNGKGTVVGTYSVLISDKYAVILKVTNTHGNGTTVLAKKQP